MSLNALSILSQSGNQGIQAASKPAGEAKETPAIIEARKAAKMMEGLFMRQLFKTMRKTVPKGGIMGGGMSQDIYTEMFDGAMADEMAKGKGVGLAEMLFSQLSAKDRPGAKLAMAALESSGAAMAALPAEAMPTRAKLPIVNGNAAAARFRKEANYKVLDGVQFEHPDRKHAKAPSSSGEQLRWPVDGPSQWLGRGGIQGEAHATVTAAGSGKVVDAGTDYLVIDHGRGLTTRYDKLGKVESQVGDLVLRGQVLGEVGRDGKLGFNARKFGKDVQVSE
jgi:Rod binding domain-containing protein